MGKNTFVGLLCAACLVLMAGCASVGTSVDNVWRDDGRAEAVPLGKTLVLALAPKAEVVVVLEEEWVRQLQDQGIDASSANLLMPGEGPPDKKRVVELVKASGFDTLLVTRVVDVKQVEREVQTYQIGVVETNLYAASTEKKFWSARADAFLRNPTSDRIEELRVERAQELVETLIREMAQSKVL